MKQCFVKLKKLNFECLNDPTLRRSQRTGKQKQTNCCEINLVRIVPPETQIIGAIQMINLIWRELTSKNFELKVGMIVCAKMKTFWPWPSRIIKFNRNQAVLKFFGDFKTGSVNKMNCIPFIHCHSVVLNYVKSIKIEQRTQWINELDETSDPSKRHSMPIRQLFLQSIRDVEISLGLSNSILDSVKQK